jgi:hypothetical protein
VAQYSHVVMIFGYLKMGDTINYLIFDPGAHLLLRPNVSLVNSWNFGNIFEGPKSFIMYLEDKQS